MIDGLTKLVAERLPIIGLAAYCVGIHDRASMTQCLSKSLYPSTTEQLLNGLIRSSRTLLRSEQTACYCWTFECLRIYVVARSDGVCLALLVENGPGVQMVRIQALLHDFAQLQETSLQPGHPSCEPVTA